jgi:hypothetical protein
LLDRPADVQRVTQAGIQLCVFRIRQRANRVENLASLL